jgi:hypothetical protein
VHLLRGLRGWRSNAAWLIRGDVAGAREAAALAASSRAAGEPFHLHHWYDLLAHVALDLYERRHDQVWARIDGAWRELERSHLQRIEAVDAESHALRGAAALLGGRTSLAARCAARLDKIGSPLSRVLLGQLRGAMAASAGDREAARHHLGAAIAAAEAAGTMAHRAAAALRLARVEGDAAGIEEALAWFRGQGVVDPWSFAAILSPGLAP